MSTILVVGEHLDGKLQSATLATVSFANKAAEIEDGEVIGLLLGSGADAAAEEFAKYVSKVIYVEDASYTNYLAEAYAPAVAKVAEELDADIIAANGTTTGKDFLPRVAARFDDSGFVADVIDVISEDDELTYKRPMWAGNVIAKMTSDAEKTFVTIRSTGFDNAEPNAGGSVEKKSGAEEASGAATFIKFDQVKSERPALTDAEVVISGGRGLKSAENFGMIEELADVLGAAVGASRAAVDSGYAPNDWQVGQTGKIVAPNLYIAVAISGAIQHLAGMKGSKTIVAINKDPEAPIYQLSDFGLVADAFDVVPELITKLK